jgi:Domain of unknown function (DUF4365)
MPISVQVKASSAATEMEAHWGHRLEVSHFNILADQDSLTFPTYLFLVIVPTDPQLYTTTPDGLLLRHAVYWHSLAGADQIVGAAKGSKTTVHVPKANLLTVDSLRTLASAPLTRVEAS